MLEQHQVHVAIPQRCLIEVVYNDIEYADVAPGRGRHSLSH